MTKKKELKPPFVLKPGIIKNSYSFPKDYCTLDQYIKAAKRLMKRQAKIHDQLLLESEMLYDNHIEDGI